MLSVTLIGVIAMVAAKPTKVITNQVTVNDLIKRFVFGLLKVMNWCVKQDGGWTTSWYLNRLQPMSMILTLFLISTAVTIALLALFSSFDLYTTTQKASPISGLSFVFCVLGIV